jgi:RNA polymerase sigma factor (TIGR02999 family)
MDITALLQELRDGDRGALNRVIPLVYQELKRLARAHLRREWNTPLQTTALVHEAFLRLAGGRHPSYENRAHFYGIVSRVMRQILVDNARARAAGKRRADQEVALAELPDWGPQPSRPLLAMEDALLELEQTDPIKGQLIEMHFFGGLTAEESSIALSMPVHIVRRELRLARAWLRQEIAGKETAAASVSRG